MKTEIEEIESIIIHLGETRGIGEPWAKKIIRLLADYRKLLKYHPLMQHEAIRNMPLGAQREGEE